MANLILTNQCNLNCSFCFATENNFGLAKKTKEEFSVADLWKISSFLKDKTIRLCGGEPTLNSNIVEIMECLLSNEFNILLMTNGLWPDNFKKYIEKLNVNNLNKIYYLFNILEIDQYTPEQYKNIKDALSLTNPSKSTLGITINKKDFEYNHLIQFSEVYSIKSIRVSVAAPNITGGDYELEYEYYAVADKLHKFLLECSRRDIRVHKDCNYIPPCFFTKEQLIDIKFSLKDNWNFTCSSSPVDIDINGNAWRCYGLFSLLRAKIKNFRNEKELKGYFNRRMKLISTNLYAYQECVNCPYWQKSCLGGCFTLRLKKAIKQNPDFILSPIDDEKEILKCIPKRNDTVVIKEDNPRCLIYHSNSVLDNSDENIFLFLKIIDGKLSVKDLIDLWSSNFDSYEETKNEVVNMCRYLFERDLIDIVYNYNISIESNKNLKNVTN